MAVERGPTFGSRALDLLPPKPAGQFTCARHHLSALREWVNGHVRSIHRDHAHTVRLAREYPDDADALWAGHHAALTRRQAEAEQATGEFERVSRILERSPNPPDHGRAWGVAPVVADAIERTANVRARRVR